MPKYFRLDGDISDDQLFIMPDGSNTNDVLKECYQQMMDENGKLDLMMSSIFHSLEVIEIEQVFDLDKVEEEQRDYKYFTRDHSAGYYHWTFKAKIALDEANTFPRCGTHHGFSLDAIWLSDAEIVNLSYYDFCTIMVNEIQSISEHWKSAIDKKDFEHLRDDLNYSEIVNNYSRVLMEVWNEYETIEEKREK